MSSVFLCSPTNSQMFTTCCETAICDDQAKCPRCKKDVYPFYEDMPDKERFEYSRHQVNMSRWNRAYKGKRT